MCPSTATPQVGLSFGRLAEQSPPTGYEPKSLIEVSSERTPIVLSSRWCSLDTNADDLATSVDASEVCDTSDVVVVDFTTVFSGARSKCFPTQCFLFSFKRGETNAGR